MANNIVPYKDIFEQKGPLLYLIHSIAYLISKTSFTGVYILESLSFGVVATFIYKTSKMFISEYASVIVSVLSITVMVLSACFYYGDSAEEFCLPFLSFGLYFLIKYFKDSKKNLNPIIFLLCGFSAGCVALIKFTVLGFWFGWMAVIAIQTLIKKELKNAFRFSFIFLFGMLLAFIPWIIYFISKDALKDFIEVYFIINTTSYADYSTAQNGLKIWIAELLSRYYHNFIKSTVLAICSLLGALSTIFIGKFTDRKLYSRFSLFFVFLTTIFFTYMGGTSFQYYFFVFGIFVCILFIAIFIISEPLINRFNNKTIKTIAVILVSVLSVLLSLSLSISSKATIKAKEKENTYQYIFSQYIKEHSSTTNPKVFTYNALDSGVYVYDNIIPEFRFFEMQNISYENFPDNLNEHIRYINDHIAEYVVILFEIPSDDKSNLINDYRLVKKIQYPVFSSEKNDIIYYTASLFELIKEE